MLNEVLEFMQDKSQSSSGSVSLESIITPELEDYVFLMAMEAECTPEEFHDLVIENAVELDMYGLLHNPSIIDELYESPSDTQIATEGTNYKKKVSYKQSKDMIYNKIKYRTALRIAKNANSPAWQKYKRGREMMIEAREEIYRMNGGKAEMATKRIMSGAAHKAAAMSNPRGASIVDKMDAQIAKFQAKRAG